MNRQWKKNKIGHFLVVVQLIHRLIQADISCTTTACLFFFPLLARETKLSFPPGASCSILPPPTTATAAVAASWLPRVGRPEKVFLFSVHILRPLSSPSLSSPLLFLPGGVARLGVVAVVGGGAAPVGTRRLLCGRACVRARAGRPPSVSLEGAWLA